MTSGESRSGAEVEKASRRGRGDSLGCVLSWRPMCGRRDGLYHPATAHCCCSAMTNSEEKAKAKTCSVSVPAASGAQGHVTPPPHSRCFPLCHMVHIPPSRTSALEVQDVWILQPPVSSSFRGDKRTITTFLTKEQNLFSKPAFCYYFSF